MDDEKFYQQVIEELRSSGPKEALWLKALTLNGGDEQKAKIQYVKWRVDQLVEEERQARANIKEIKKGKVKVNLTFSIILIIIVAICIWVSIINELFLKK